MPVKHWAEGGVYWNPTHPGVPPSCCFSGQEASKSDLLVAHCWYPSILLSHPFAIFFLLFGNGMSTKLVFFTILPATETRTSGRATGYLPPCSEDGQSCPGCFKLHPVYVGCQQIQNGQRKRACHCACGCIAVRFRSRAWCVQALYDFTPKVCFLCIHLVPNCLTPFLFSEGPCESRSTFSSCSSFLLL